MIKRLPTSFSNQVQTITEAIKVLCFVSQFLKIMPEILPSLGILSTLQVLGSALMCYSLRKNKRKCKMKEIQ